jgi:magnesium chelatase subunit H
VDAVVSLTGFSLVGGPAYNDSRAAEEMLAGLDVPYVSAHSVEFQTLEQWESSDRGLLPVEATMMVAIPELDGSIGSVLYGGRSSEAPAERSRDMQAHPERVAALAARVARMVVLRRTPPADRKVAIVLFNFPPNAGSTGTAAHLDVFASLRNTLLALRGAGYSVGDVPATEAELRERVTAGNAAHFGADANVAARILVDDHVRREPHLAQIEAQWGPAPAGSRPTAARSLSWASGSGTCWSASSPPSATRATRCGSSSSTGSRRPTPSPPSTATLERTSPPTPSSTSAPTGRWSSCRASRPGSRPAAGRSG